MNDVVFKMIEVEIRDAHFDAFSYNYEKDCTGSWSFSYQRKVLSVGEALKLMKLHNKWRANAIAQGMNPELMPKIIRAKSVFTYIVCNTGVHKCTKKHTTQYDDDIIYL